MVSFIYRNVTFSSPSLTESPVLTLVFLFPLLLLLLFPGLNWRNKHQFDSFLDQQCIANESVLKSFICGVHSFYHANVYQIGVPLQLLPIVIIPVIIRPSISRISLGFIHVIYLLLIIRPKMFPDFRGSPQYNTSFFFPLLSWVCFCLSHRPISKVFFLLLMFVFYPYVCSDDADPHYNSHALCYNGSESIPGL